MNIRKIVLSGAVGLGLMAGGYMIGQGPLPPNVDPNRHPNLAAAQLACDEAYAKVMLARRANEFEMGGHGARAEQLLADARREIRLAALAANHR